MTKSMTAYARTSENGDFGNITWEVKSLNHRYLDLSLRIPDALRHLESKLREIIHGKIHRGRVECFLKFQAGENTKTNISLNTNLIKQLSKTCEKVGKYFNKKSASINPLHVLSWNDVLQINETIPQATNNKIIKIFEQTINKLINTKKSEGNELKKIIEQKLVKIQDETTKVSKHLPNIKKEQRKKIITKLENIKTELDQSRLEQEMVFFAQKTDVAEELERLQMHVKEMKKILSEKDAIGKRLDFLSQELNREANTLASKSASKETTQAAIELKVLIEEIREQVQNIE